MTEPNQPTTRPTSSSTSPTGSPPETSGAPVRWQQVAAGFGIAFLVAMGIRVALWTLVLLLPTGSPVSGLAGGLMAWFAPIPVLIGMAWWSAQRGRKGRAIGMSIYAGLAVLLVAACFATTMG